MKIRLPRNFLMIVFGVMTIAMFTPVAAAASKSKSKSLDVSIAKAPISPDGTTAGAVTDFVITFEDINPEVDGVRLHNGATIEIVLSDEFTNIGAGNNTAIILQGWPQSPPAPPFPWITDVAGNMITLTLTDDFKPNQFGPGAKQIHLILFGFTNPVSPGVYPVELLIRPKRSGKKSFSGSSHVRILPDARPSVNPISLFSGPPGPPPPFFNPIYQTLGLGEAARRIGLYLWDSESAPFVGVELRATFDPTYYQLVVGVANIVGEVWITPPDGAVTFYLSNVVLPPGGPPSVAVSAFVTEVPVGLLGIQFFPDSQISGDYEIAISMKGGNETTLFVTVLDE